MIARTFHSPDKDYIGFNVALRSTQATTKDRCGDFGPLRTFEETVERMQVDISEDDCSVDPTN